MSDYNLDTARVDAQREKMKQLQRDNVCAFCPEHFDNFHDNPIEIKTDHWLVTKNDYPYEHTSLHLLVIPAEHVTTVSELSPAAKADYLDVIAKIEKHFKLTTYGVAMRSGDFRYNGGSVRHLHAHLLVGDFSDPDNHQKLKFKFSSVPKQ